MPNEKSKFNTSKTRKPVNFQNSYPFGGSSIFNDTKNQFNAQTNYSEPLNLNLKNYLKK